MSRERIEFEHVLIEPYDPPGPDPGDFCPECGGEGEHGQGCGYVAQALADHAFDHHGPHR